MENFHSKIPCRIRSIRCRGYDLFHRPILCGIYSRAATNRERRLLNLSLAPDHPLFQCALDTADEAEESDPFADIEVDELDNELVRDDCMLNCILLS